MGTAAGLGEHPRPLRVVGRIDRQSSFRALRRPAGRAARGPIRASYVAPPRDDVAFPQVGYAISRRCGNAVTRNRLRRRLRVAVQTAARAGLPGGCYLVQTQPPAATLDFETLSRYVAEVLQRAGAAGRDRRPTTTTPAP